MAEYLLCYNIGPYTRGFSKATPYPLAYVNEELKVVEKKLKIDQEVVHDLMFVEFWSVA
jgi:hypothetical protein